MIVLWAVATGREMARLSGQGEYIICMAFSPDGQSLACGDLGDDLWLRDIATGERRDPEKPWWLGDTSVDYPTFVGFSSDGEALASIVDDRIGLWDTASGIHRGTSGPTLPWTVTSDGRLVALFKAGNAVTMWEVPASPTGLMAALGVAGLILLGLAVVTHVRDLRRQGAISESSLPGQKGPMSPVVVAAGRDA